MVEEDNEQILENLFAVETNGDIDLYKIMVNAAHAAKSKVIHAAHMSKVWRIYQKISEPTLDIISQGIMWTNNPTLSRNYGTNNRMLWYKQIHEYFFMDKFFATKKARKFSRLNTCCQLFVTDKGFVYVVLVRSKE